MPLVKKIKHLLLVTPPPPTQSPVLITKRTLSCPGSQGAAVIDDMVESEGQDEEGAVAGSVHLEGHVPLVQTHRLTFLGQRRLEQFSSHLEGTMCTGCFC